MFPRIGRALTRECAGVALLCTAITAVLAFPLSTAPGSTVLPHGSDTGLFLWTIGWNVHALFHQPWAIFDANIFHPFRYSLAYSENLIGSSLLVAPVVWATGNLVLALNLAALSSVVLCAVGVYVLGRRAGLLASGALVAAIVFAFAPPRFFRIGQPHLTAVQWMPLCLAFLHGYFEGGRRRDLRWAIAFFGLQTLTSGHGALFTAVAIALMLAWRFALGEPLQPARRLADVGVLGAVLITAPLLLLLPYRYVQQESGLRRTLEEASLSSADLPSLLATPNAFDASIIARLTKVSTADANALLFPGFITLALGAAGFCVALGRASGQAQVSQRASGSAGGWNLIAKIVELALAFTLAVGIAAVLVAPFRLRLGDATLLSVRSAARPLVAALLLAVIRWGIARQAPIDAKRRLHAWGQRLGGAGRRLRTDAVVYCVLLAAITFWLALGPSFGLYEWLYGLPGGNFVRVPSRFTIVTLMALAVVAGAGLDWLTRSFSARARWIATGVVSALLLAEFAAFPLIIAPFAVEIPAADRWLDSQPKPFVVAELPSAEGMQAHYMLHSMAHWQKTIHGYSGARPGILADLYKALDAFPTTDLLNRLESLGVTYIVVHTNIYPEPRRAPLLAAIEQFGDRLQLVHEDEADRVYLLRGSEQQ